MNRKLELLALIASLAIVSFALGLLYAIANFDASPVFGSFKIFHWLPLLIGLGGYLCWAAKVVWNNILSEAPEIISQRRKEKRR